MKYKERDKQHQSEWKKDMKFAQREREREREREFVSGKKKVFWVKEGYLVKSVDNRKVLKEFKKIYLKTKQKKHMVLWDWADRVVWNSNKYSPLRNRKDTAPYWPFIFKESEGIQVQAPLVWSVNSKRCLLFLRCHVGIHCWIGALWPLISGGSTTPLGKSSGKQGFKIFIWILVFIYGIIDNKRIFFFLPPIL